MATANITELSQKVLNSVAPLVRPLIDAFSVGFDESQRLGDVVKVPVYSGNGTTAVYNASTNNYNNINGVTDWKNVGLDTVLKATFKIEDYEKGRISEDQIAATSSDIIFTGLVAQIMGKITAANYSATAVTGVAAADFGDDDVLTALGVADAADFGASRSMILAPGHYNSLLKIYGAALGNQSEVTRSGVLGNVLGFDVLKAKVTANGEKLAGFVCDRSAICLGIGQMGDASEGLAVDPSGFRIYTWESEDTATHAKLLNFATVIGVSVGQATHLARITTP